MPAALRPVAYQQHAFGNSGPDFVQRGNGARDVGGGGDDRHFRIGLYQRRKPFGGNITVGHRAYVVRDDARFF